MTKRDIRQIRRLLLTLRTFREDARREAEAQTLQHGRASAAHRRGMRDAYGLSAKWLAQALRETRYA